MRDGSRVRATRAATHSDVHVLAGAYVLDAVSDAERGRFERHVTACGSCAVEVAEFRATVTRLGLAATVRPPPGLREAVLTAVHRTRRPARGVFATGARSRGGRPALALVSLAAGVLLVAVVALGVALTRIADDRAVLGEQLTAVTDAVRSGDAELVHEDGGRRGALVAVVARDRDRAVLVSALPPPPPGRVHQVWLTGAGFRSVGLLRPPHGPRFHELSGLAGGTGLVITVEPAGGSAQPTTPPLVRVRLG